jgi:3-deoxy-D-manno-octulosonic-acid transferase
MIWIYQLIIQLVAWILPVLAMFSPKLKLFVDGRKNVFQQLKTQLKSTDQIIWFHVASLGEYEQGLPVMEALKKQLPQHKILLTFFSPSGFEVRKNNTVADCTLYLPLDTYFQAKKFVQLVKPEMVFFIKYEFWPNYLRQLKKRQIETFLISGIFREKQLFFRWYGGFYRQLLTTFNHFFVQNEKSANLLQSLGFLNVTKSGDTRFDRVSQILQKQQTLDFMRLFKADQALFVAGSTWKKDEDLLVEMINQCTHAFKFVIAPHNIKKDDILVLKAAIQKKTILYSEMNSSNLADFEVLILDTIGLLTQVYRYADMVYVGGGFGQPGVHNVLEPAVFGVPIIIGPNYDHFQEAILLVQSKGCQSINTPAELKQAVDALMTSPKLRQACGQLASDFVVKHGGATETIMNHILSKKAYQKISV